MVTHCAATRNVAVAGRCVAAGRCVVVDHSAAVDRCAEAGRDAAADHFVVLVPQIEAFHDVVLVEIPVALNVAQSAVRKSSWVDRVARAPCEVPGVAQDVAQVAVRLVVQIVAQVVFPETTQASRVVRCVAHSAVHCVVRCVARDCCAAAGSPLPADRAGVSQLLPAAWVAQNDHRAVPDVPQAGLT